MSPATSSDDRVAPDRGDGGDNGSTLVFVLVMTILCSLIVVPTLTFAMAVMRQSEVHQDKAERAEAVKGGLRVAMASPLALYKTCENAQLTQGISLPSPLLDIPVSTECFWIGDVNEETPETLRFGAAVTQVGASLPPASANTSIFPGSAQAPETAWVTETTSTSTQGKIWLPNLPVHGINRRSAAGYPMPSGYRPCKVYFPGTYVDPILITGPDPVYFTSGVYYFENDVKITGGADVVVGYGDEPGCVDSDQLAAFYATDAPRTHNISGHGATFVFGDASRMIIDNSLPGAVKVLFNQRYVSTADEVTGSGGVSIMSVNGKTDSVAGTSTDIDIPGFLHVPLSSVASEVPVTAPNADYKVSTLVPAPATVPPDPPVTPVNPILDINLTTADAVTVTIPGYVSVPQGVVQIASPSAAVSSNKSIALAGGVVAADFWLSATPPANQFIGLENPVVQRILKIVSATTSGSPQMTSTAIVQVNQFGAWAIESWEVQNLAAG